MTRPFPVVTMLAAMVLAGVLPLAASVGMGGAVLRRPVISLDLDSQAAVNANSQYNFEIGADGKPLAGLSCRLLADQTAAYNKYGYAKGKGTMCRDRQGSQAYGGGSHGYKEVFSKECTAKQATATTCPLPTAAAYDHHDGNLAVIERLFLVNNDGVKGDITKTYTAVDYNLRSEWLASYDATDASGNSAQQIVFSLILNDHIPPVVTPGFAFPLTLEACDPDNTGQRQNDPLLWGLPIQGHLEASDNYDATSYCPLPSR